MKEHISIEDVQELNDSQKQNLRYFWMPEVNDLAVASIITNVETDAYDHIPFVIGEVIVDENRRGVTLRRYRLLDESFFDENQELFENEGSYEMEYAEPEQFFNKEDCLPLLNIGQMLHFLRAHKYGQNGFKIAIPPAGNKLFEEVSFVLEDNYGEAFSHEELCDCLWQAVKTVLH